jgi:hypothetical protein
MLASPSASSLTTKYIVFGDQPSAFWRGYSRNGATAARRAKKFGERELLSKIRGESFGHFDVRVAKTRINEHKFGSLCSPRHACQRQKPVFYHRPTRKIGQFRSPVWDPFP